MKRYLVTGAAGFIGTNLVRSLLEKDSSVHVIIEPHADIWRLTDIQERLTIHHVDLLDFEGIKKVVKEVKPDVVYHLAASGVIPNKDTVNTIYKVNFDATRNLLDAASEAGFECFISTGSSSEYSLQKSLMSETDLPMPITDYGVAKLAATQYCLKRALFDKLPVYVVRPFLVYGDFEFQTRLVPTLICAALDGVSPSLSNPALVRDFIYVHDVVDFFTTIEKIKPHDAFVFNAGTGTQTALGHVVEVLEEIFGKTLEARWGSTAPRPWDFPHWADMSRAEQLLGWKAKHSLKEGLLKGVTWFRENRDKYSFNQTIRNDTPYSLQQKISA